MTVLRFQVKFRGVAAMARIGWLIGWLAGLRASAPSLSKPGTISGMSPMSEPVEQTVPKAALVRDERSARRSAIAAPRRRLRPLVPAPRLSQAGRDAVPRGNANAGRDRRRRAGRPRARAVSRFSRRQVHDLQHRAGERWHPKGNGQNARTMELYRRLGFSDEVRRLGLPGDHPFDQAYFTRLIVARNLSLSRCRAATSASPCGGRCR